MTTSLHNNYGSSLSVADDVFHSVSPPPDTCLNSLSEISHNVLKDICNCGFASWWCSSWVPEPLGDCCGRLFLLGILWGRSQHVTDLKSGVIMRCLHFSRLIMEVFFQIFQDSTCCVTWSTSCWKITEFMHTALFSALEGISSSTFASLSVLFMMVSLNSFLKKTNGTQLSHCTPNCHFLHRQWDIKTFLWFLIFPEMHVLLIDRDASKPHHWRKNLQKVRFIFSLPRNLA